MTFLLYRNEIKNKVLRNECCSAFRMMASLVQFYRGYHQVAQGLKWTAAILSGISLVILFRVLPPHGVPHY